MANTTALREAFDWVRSELGREYGQEFAKRHVPLRTGGQRTFNAVSVDRSVVATVMNSSGATAGGKKPVGKIRGALAELYYLTLAQANTRLLLLTNDEFLKYVQAELEGALPAEITVRYLPLPDALAARVAVVTGKASDEMTR